MIYFVTKYHIRQMIFICLFGFGSFQVVLSQEYFQQQVNYNIQVSLNDKRHELNAFETVQYINNSPDTLHFIWFHLWPNAYSDNTTPLAKQLLRLNGKQKLFTDPELEGFIDSLNRQRIFRRTQRHALPQLRQRGDVHGSAASTAESHR